MYLLGSTGQPKGVCVPHAAISRLVLNTNYIRLGPGDRVGQAATPPSTPPPSRSGGRCSTALPCTCWAARSCSIPPAWPAISGSGGVASLFLTGAVQPLGTAGRRYVPGLGLPALGGEAVDPRWVAAVLEGRPRPCCTSMDRRRVRRSPLAGGGGGADRGGTDAHWAAAGQYQVYVLDAQRQAVGIGIRVSCTSAVMELCGGT